MLHPAAYRPQADMRQVIAITGMDDRDQPDQGSSALLVQLKSARRPQGPETLAFLSRMCWFRHEPVQA
jgi:hypothetical protein